MRQYEAEGREKADGYSPADFDGLSEPERDRARAMMLDRALQGDSIDLSGLRYIGNAVTIEALTASDATGRFAWDLDVIRHQVLYELTAEQHWLTDLSLYLDGRNGEAQQRAANVFAWYVLPPAMGDFLADRIVDNWHEAAILPLIQAWIGVQMGQTCDLMCFQRHLDLIRSVANARPGRRRDLLDAAASDLRAARSRPG